MKFQIFSLLVVALILSHGNTKAQNVLFVNDNNYITYNTDTVLNALTGTGIEYDIFNASDSMRSPTAAEMAPYLAVIWYCSTDGANGYLWNGTDSDNAELIVYLENGGRVMVIGTDFLYDRYGSPGDVFSAGSFPYDYLGIASYDVQSYGDDGGVGVPQLLPVTSLPLPIVNWIFPTAWWVDGVTPANMASSLYKMGPDTYTLAGKDAAIVNEWFHCVSLFFDPAIMDSYANRVQLLKVLIVNYLMPIVPGLNENSKKMSIPLINSEIPAKNSIQCLIPPIFTDKSHPFTIIDNLGRKIISKTVKNESTFTINISSLTDGMYVLQTSDKGKYYFQKFVVKH